MLYRFCVKMNIRNCHLIKYICGILSKEGSCKIMASNLCVEDDSILSDYRVLNIANNFIMLCQEDDGTEPPITNMKLQKLLYYAQGWYLATENKPLFKEDFKKWQYGPVCVEVYEQFKYFGGTPITSYATGVKSTLDDYTAEFIKLIWDIYKKYSAIELSNLSHIEDPWKNAEMYQVISKEAIMDFFSKKLQQIKNEVEE